MSLKITEKEIQNVIKLPGEERYKYFTKKVADYGYVWGLYNNGWALAGDDKDNQYIPLWPSKEYASLCALGQWQEFKPKNVEIHEFLDNSLNEFISSAIKVAVFYTPFDKGVTPTYKQLKEDIQAELSKIE